MNEASARLESLLAFWLDAGAEVALASTPQDRTRPISGAPSPHASQPKLPRRGTQEASPGGPDRDQALAQAWRIAKGAADLDSLAAAIAAFEGCPLKGMGARQAVFYRGAADAPIMIVGEGPGAEEDLQGAPFVGRAGRLLDRMLGAAGLNGRVFITNTVFWRPPGNRTPSPAEQAVCAPFLERAIELVKPRLLLLAGAAATQSVLRQKGGILSLRGRWSEWASADDATRLPALPTLHPAFLLRTPAAKKMAWADMLSLAARLDEIEQVR
ncbi:MAG TPA: uracil-DNA glycosylase [Caulobacteraceae bacterium]|nr:uracil-DNA glycosylase [Caulobacteraceae bacterium]